MRRIWPGAAAVVVFKPGAEITAASISKALDQRLAKFKLPKRVSIVPELPRNTMGKVQKNQLRDRYIDIYGNKAEAGS